MIKYKVLIAWILHDCSCQYSLLCQVSFEYPVSTVLTIVCSRSLGSRVGLKEAI